MSEKIGITFTANYEDWEKLAQITSKEALTEIAKHDKHLQKQEFRGQRTTHILWDKAHRNIVAKHALVCDSTRDVLIGSFRHIHKSLLEQIEKVSIDTFDEDIVRVQASVGVTEKDRDSLLWALILDSREEIRQALENGLKEQLADASSQLVLKAELYQARNDLEHTRQELSDLREEKQTLEEQAKQLPELQVSIERLQAQVAEFIDQYDTQEQILRTINNERDDAIHNLEEAQAKIQELQVTLADEQERYSNYGRDMKCLQKDVEEKIQQIKEISAERDRLQRSAGKAEQAKLEAYEKRDEEMKKREELEVSLSKVERAKESLIVRVRSLNQQFEERKEKVLDEQLAKLMPEIIRDFDRTWKQAMTSIANQIQETLDARTYPQRSVSSQEKLDDWSHWQQTELELVTSLFSSQSLEVVDLYLLKHTQQLLILRWYLLEWFKFTTGETLQANSEVLL